MKKRILEYGLLTLILSSVFCFWFFAYPGHLSMWYWDNFFSTESSFFMEFLEEKNLLLYISNFFILFFKWTCSGALIMTLSLLIVYLLYRELLKKLQYSSSLYVLALIPVALLFAFQMSRMFVFSRTIFVVFFLIFVLGYLWKINQPKLHVVVAIFLFVLSFWCFNNIELVYFYTICCFVELLNNKSKTKYIFSVIALLLAVYFFVDFLMVKDLTPEFKNPFALQILCFPLFVVLLLIGAKFSFIRTARQSVFFIIVSLILSSLSVFFIVKDKLQEEHLYEKLFCLNQLLLDEKCDEMIDLVKSEQQRTIEFFPFLVYAHAKKGDLPEHLFDYSIDSKTLFLPKALPSTSVQTSTLGIFFNRDLGFLNEVIHQTFLMSTSHSNGETLFAMRYLPQFHLEKNDSLLTEKYLKKLNKTIVNKREVKALREQLKENVKTNVFFHDSMLFINSLQANNLRIAYLSNPDNVFARDVFFCSLLQRREYNMFCAFCGEYIKENQVLPILYQEALLMGQEMGIASLDNSRFFISDEVKKRWQEFVNIFNSSLDNRSKELQLRSFRRTWWYYCLMSPEPLN